VVIVDADMGRSLVWVGELTLSKKIPHPPLVPPPNEAHAGHEDDGRGGTWLPVIYIEGLGIFFLRCPLSGLGKGEEAKGSTHRLSS